MAQACTILVVLVFKKTLIYPSFYQYFRNYVDGEERFTIIGVTSGSVRCGGGLPDFYEFLQQEKVNRLLDPILFALFSLESPLDPHRCCRR